MEKITFKGMPVSLLGTEIKVNDKAPDFTVTANDMSQKKLSDYKGKVVILSLFPSIDTEVCAMQTRRFNEEASRLSDDIVILCISNDLPFAQTRFCGAQHIDRVITLSDYNGHDFGYKYGFLIKELNLLARGVVVIDKKGIVQYVEYVPEVTDEPAYEPAIEAAKKYEGEQDYAGNMSELIQHLQDKIGLPAEQAKEAAHYVKEYIKDKTPSLIDDKLDDIFDGKKVEFSDILKDKANNLTDNGKQALGEMASYIENVADKASNKTADVLNKLADFLKRNKN